MHVDLQMRQGYIIVPKHYMVYIMISHIIANDKKLQAPHDTATYAHYDYIIYLVHLLLL